VFCLPRWFVVCWSLGGAANTKSSVYLLVVQLEAVRVIKHRGAWRKEPAKLLTIIWLTGWIVQQLQITGNKYFDGRCHSCEKHGKTVGPYGLGMRNERERLIEWCEEKKLAIMNTCFEAHPRRRYTWTSPGDHTRNQIDYIMINERCRSSYPMQEPIQGPMQTVAI